MPKFYKICFIGFILLCVGGIGISYGQFKKGTKLSSRGYLKNGNQKTLKKWTKKTSRTLNEYQCAIVDHLPENAALDVLFDGGYGFAVGTNAFEDKQKANFYDLSDATYTELTDVIFAAYVDVPDSSKSVTIRVFDGTSGSPGASLGSAPITLKAIADSFAASSYVQVTFATPIHLPVSKKIFVSIDFSNLSIFSPDDEYFGLISTDFGMPYNLAWEQWIDNSWHSFAELSEAGDTWEDSLVIEMYPVICGDIVTPVKFDKFSATAFGTANKLEWTTQTESGSKGFEIQRSADGFNFTAIAFIPSKNGGNSTSTVSYSYVDNAPSPGNNFYRVKQVDINAKSSISKTLLITRDKTLKAGILASYPNPVKNVVNLQLVAQHGSSVLTFTNMAGVAVKKQTVQTTGSNQTIQVDVSALPKGAYFVKMNGENNSIKFIKD